MKYGIREICDVVLKAKAPQKLGKKIFYKGEPVMYFDTLKTSTLEGAATTVYADGGRGNTHLVAWEGERTVTFTMEDALISSEGLSILTGAGLVDASELNTGLGMKVHVTERIQLDIDNFDGTEITLENVPVIDGGKDDEDYIYVMLLDANGDIKGQPYIGSRVGETNKIVIKEIPETERAIVYTITDEPNLKTGDVILVDYYRYVDQGSQIEITADKFAGNYYLEASTLFRDKNGKDLPAEFIIPNCKIQSNFTFSLASTGDPSTFTFTMDAFPDYTKFDKTKKVLATIQVVEETEDSEDIMRDATRTAKKWDEKLNTVTDKGADDVEYIVMPATIFAVGEENDGAYTADITSQVSYKGTIAPVSGDVTVADKKITVSGELGTPIPIKLKVGSGETEKTAEAKVIIYTE